MFGNTQRDRRITALEDRMTWEENFTEEFSGETAEDLEALQRQVDVLNLTMDKMLTFCGDMLQLCVMQHDRLNSIMDDELIPFAQLLGKTSSAVVREQNEINEEIRRDVDRMYECQNDDYDYLRGRIIALEDSLEWQEVEYSDEEEN